MSGACSARRASCKQFAVGLTTVIGSATLEPEMRAKTLLIAAIFTLGAVSACSGPHSGKEERLKKPRKKERPEGEEAPTETPTAAVDGECRTNFFAEPTKRRSAGDAERIAAQADPLLAEAEELQGAERASRLIQAVSKLTNALEKDPYGPIATFKLAVAYAMAGRQKCAIALLDRLKTLQKHPDVEREAARTVKRALKDPAFASFRKDADAALGE